MKTEGVGEPTGGAPVSELPRDVKERILLACASGIDQACLASTDRDCLELSRGRQDLAMFRDRRRLARERLFGLSQREGLHLGNLRACLRDRPHLLEAAGDVCRLEMQGMRSGGDICAALDALLALHRPLSSLHLACLPAIGPRPLMPAMDGERETAPSSASLHMLELRGQRGVHLTFRDASLQGLTQRARELSIVDVEGLHLVACAALNSDGTHTPIHALSPVRVRELSLHGCPKLVDLWLLARWDLAHLEVLSLRGCRHLFDDLRLLEQTPRLTALDTRGTAIDYDEVSEATRARLDDLWMLDGERQKDALAPAAPGHNSVAAP